VYGLFHSQSTNNQCYHSTKLAASTLLAVWQAMCEGVIWGFDDAERGA